MYTTKMITATKQAKDVLEQDHVTIAYIPYKVVEAFGDETATHFKLQLLDRPAETVELNIPSHFIMHVVTPEEKP